MKSGPPKSNDVKRVTKQEARLLNEGLSTKETAKSSTTSDTIQPEVWIAFGLVSSLVLQIVAVSLLIKDTDN